MAGRAAAASRGYIQPAYAASGNEDQDHRNDERQQTEKFGCGEADEQAALLTVSGGGVAQRACEERTENITHAERGHASANRGQTCTDQPCSFRVQDRKSGGQGKSASVRVDLGGRRNDKR